MNNSLYYIYLTYSKFKDSKGLNLNSMDAQKEIISYLKFLGKVKKGEKINIKGMFVQPDGMLTKLSRTFLHPDNRENTKVFLVSTIRQSLDLLDISLVSKKSSDKIMAARIIKDLMVVRDNGLKNLKSTYFEDNMFCCQIDTIIETIDAKLSEILDTYPDILNYEEEKASPALSHYSSSSSREPPPLSLDEDEKM